MTESNSTAPTPKGKPIKSKHRKRRPGKRHPGEPTKPYKDFPLFTVSSGNGTGRWAKKIRGKLYYFGSWDDPDSALAKYLDQKDDLYAGRKPGARRHQDGGATMLDLANQFSIAKKNRVESGELKQCSYHDYCRVCESLLQAFGPQRLLSDIRPRDFEELRAAWAKKCGPVRLGNEINRARVIFNFAYQNELIDKPVRFGSAFRRPPKKVLRLAKEAKGKRLFDAEELRGIIAAARQPMKTMILLGVNCGLGNSDVARMTIKTLDLAGGWINYPRPKTGVARRCALWPETVASLREWLAVRPSPTDPTNAQLVFLTSYRLPWYRETSDNPISRVMRNLLVSLKITGNKNFYALRHTHETVGGASLDQVAVNAIMGHVDPTMAGEYREEVTDDRLAAVADHIRVWLFGKSEKAKPEMHRLRIARDDDDEAAASA
jgi:integrase